MGPGGRPRVRERQAFVARLTAEEENLDRKRANRFVGPAFLLALCAGASFARAVIASHGLPVPAPPAPGFVLSRGPEFYGTEARPLENGNIFNFIDGGGVVYINHGFQAVVHVIFSGGKSGSITVDIYDMGSEANAREACRDEAICPSGSIPVSIGSEEAKSYHFEPDFYVYFIRGRYLVYAYVDNDAQSGLLTAYAAALSKEIR